MTYDERMDLADQLALGARIVAWIAEHSRRAADMLTGNVNF